MAMTVDREVRKLKSDLGNLRGDLSRVFGRMGNVTRLKSRDWLGQTGTQLGHGFESAEEAVTRYPMQSLLIALGVGLLLGRMLRIR
jgi:ElaB/YqjD/DUF883 family membrane-anchored ribosome-binding protein